MADGLTLEKLKIDERLREVEKVVAEGRPIKEQILKSLDKLEKTIEKIDCKINGNGSPGIEDRLKTIEAAEEGRKKSFDSIIKISYGAITALVVTICSWIGKIIISLIHVSK